jgi:secreted PhoX family phosphatase
MDRRSFIRAGVAGSAVAAVAAVSSPLEALAAPAVVGPGPYGPLGPANADGIQLPAGFTSRLIATSGRRVGSTGYTWHYSPDGGACFPATAGGGVYASNA